jgi:hypothetical protein
LDQINQRLERINLLQKRHIQFEKLQRQLEEEKEKSEQESKKHYFKKINYIMQWIDDTTQRNLKKDLIALTVFAILICFKHNFS